jgi:hypothetical protein
MIFKNFFNKYIGKTQYDVTVTNVSGLVDSYLVSSKKDLVILVEEINTSSYWSVSKIEKSRKLKFKYDGSIKHQALHFGLEGVTEDPFCGSGTTPKMALINKRNFIASELSDEYCDISNNRLKEIL